MGQEQWLDKWLEGSGLFPFERTIAGLAKRGLSAAYSYGVSQPQPNEDEQRAIDIVDIRLAQIEVEKYNIRHSQNTRSYIQSVIDRLTKEEEELEDRFEQINDRIAAREDADRNRAQQQDKLLHQRWKTDTETHTDTLIQHFEAYKEEPASPEERDSIKLLARSMSETVTGDMAPPFVQGREGDLLYDWNITGIPEYPGVQRILGASGKSISRRYVDPSQVPSEELQLPQRWIDAFGTPSEEFAGPRLLRQKQVELSRLKDAGASKDDTGALEQEIAHEISKQRPKGPTAPQAVPVFEGQQRDRINNLMREVISATFGRELTDIEDTHIDSFMNFTGEYFNNEGGIDYGSAQELEAIWYAAMDRKDLAPDGMKEQVQQLIDGKQYEEVISDLLVTGVRRAGEESPVTIFDVFKENHQWLAAGAYERPPTEESIYDMFVSRYKKRGVSLPLMTEGFNRFLYSDVRPLLLQARINATSPEGLDIDAFHIAVEDLVNERVATVQSMGGIEVAMKQQQSADFLKGLSDEDQFRVAIQGTDVNPFNQRVALDRLKKRITTARIRGEEINIPQWSIEALEAVQKEGPAYMPEVTQEQRDRLVALGIDLGALQDTYPGRIAAKALLDLTSRDMDVTERRTEGFIASAGEVSPAEEADIRSRIEKTTQAQAGDLTRAGALAQAAQAKEEEREFALTFPQTQDEFRASRERLGVEVGPEQKTAKQQRIEDYRSIVVDPTRPEEERGADLTEAQRQDALRGYRTEPYEPEEEPEPVPVTPQPPRVSGIAGRKRRILT